MEISYLPPKNVTETSVFYYWNAYTYFIGDWLLYFNTLINELICMI